MHAIVDSEATILHVIILIVQVHVVLGATEALSLTVLVDTPQDINTLVNRLLVAELAEEGRCNGPKSDVLDLQLEKG